MGRSQWHAADLTSWALVEKKNAYTLNVAKKHICTAPAYGFYSLTKCKDSFCLITCVSREDVGSSQRRMGAFLSMARAMATRCFSPPDIISPRSPTTVSYPCKQAKKKHKRGPATRKTGQDESQNITTAKTAKTIGYNNMINMIKIVLNSLLWVTLRRDKNVSARFKTVLSLLRFSEQYRMANRFHEHQVHHHPRICSVHGKAKQSSKPSR